MDHYQTVTAIVIGKKSYKDSDILVNLITNQDLKISALAKGVKNIKSSRLSALGLGNLIQAQIYQKNNFLWLTEAKSHRSFLATRKSLTQLNLLFFLLEIINRFTAENQHIGQIFPITNNLISSINDNQIPKFIINEVSLLRLFGFGIPAPIDELITQKKYPSAQRLIKQFAESVIEQPLYSSRLFK
ncbi:MAG: DNA repair protein RecO [Candidatus Shapirobacteria bacterium]|jgi:DNA repair protein RecO (recombination protein O)